MFKLDLENVEEPEIKLPTSVGSRKRVLMNLFTGQDRDPDIENRLVDTAREGESGTN